jgi:hypothetical protein
MKQNGLTFVILVGAIASCTIPGGPGSGAAETPTFDPPAGAYAATQNVAMASATPGAHIRYTTDGTDPTGTTGTLYTAPLPVSASTTIRAVAYGEGYLDSAVAVAAYSITASANELVDAAYDFMRDGDWAAALDAFSQALLVDPQNGVASMGYAVLNIAAITVDPELVGVARDRMGLVDYPDDMATVLSPDWLVDMYAESGGTNQGLMPNVSGQAAFAGWNGDESFVDPIERMLALAAFATAHNPTGPSALLSAIASSLGGRLDAAIEAIDAVDESLSMSIDWRMVAANDGAPPEWWPMDDAGEPIVVVFGKGEALAIAGFLGAVRTAVEIAQVYNLSLPLAEYWSSFGPDSTAGDPDQTQRPFSGDFLNLSPSSAAHLAAARSAWIRAADNTMAAAGLVGADRSGFSLSSGSAWLFSTPEQWSDFRRMLDIGSRTALELKESLVSSRMAILPKGSVDLDNWPAAPLDPETEIGLNLYLYFDAPVGLSTALLEIQRTSDANAPHVGEPVFYVLADGALRAVTRGDIDALGGASGGQYDFRGDVLDTYLRVVDVTLGGVMPTANLRLDDPLTPSTFNLWYSDANMDGKWTWTDADLDGVYDPGEGEGIQTPQFQDHIEGAVDLSRLAEYGGDPVSWYSLKDSHLDPYLMNATPANRQALRAAINAYLPIYIQRLTLLDGTSLYIPGLPLDTIWHAYTTAGVDSAYTDGSSGSPVASRGSIYWSIAGGLGW